jgi:hypothetical protein
MKSRTVWIAGLRLIMLLPALIPAWVHAQAIEGALMPGQLITDHAKWEQECRKCHTPFRKDEQPDLCLDCHKKTAAEVRNRTQFHGTLDDKTCRLCHTEHKGRNGVITNPDVKKFDHDRTFALKGGHKKIASKCASCHLPKAKYKDAPRECDSCHRKDDVHKGKLGKKCEQCHNETNWKNTKNLFDHNKTRFKLEAGHADVECKECHKSKEFKDTPRECVSCHKKDDETKKKAHKGRFGPKCETCHTAKKWTDITFDHDRDTKYKLLGKHIRATCASCHTGWLYRDKTSTKCVDCHRKDDQKNKNGHRGKFGDKCETCHTERNWKDTKFDHDRDTKYKLLGKHIQATCVSCHTGWLYRDKTSTKCIDCHRKDDQKKGHRGKLGNRCESCHNENGWKIKTFDHSKSRFPLTGSHTRVECNKCHKSTNYRDAPSACDRCHLKDDVHKRRLGLDCETCHNTRTWKSWDYDHSKTGFILDGGHRTVECYACHKTPMQKARVRVVRDCFVCHAKSDVHRGSFGTACQRCHTGGAWLPAARR